MASSDRTWRAWIVNGVRRLGWPVLLPLCLLADTGWELVDTRQTVAVLTDPATSTAQTAVVVRSESTGRSWATDVSFVDRSVSRRTERLVVGSKRLMVGQQLAVRYETADPGLVSAAPVDKVFLDDQREAVAFLVFGALWLAGGMTYVALTAASPGRRGAEKDVGRYRLLRLQCRREVRARA